MADVRQHRVRLGACALALLALLWGGWHVLCPKVAKQFQNALGDQVHLEQVRLSWHGFSPAIYGKHLKIEDEQHRALQADAIWITLDFFDSLRKHHWVLDTIHMKHATLTSGPIQMKGGQSHFVDVLGVLLAYVHRVEIDALHWLDVDPAWPWPKIHKVRGYVLSDKAILEGALVDKESHVDVLLEWDRVQTWSLSRWAFHYEGNWKGATFAPLQKHLALPAILSDMDASGSLSLSMHYSPEGNSDVIVSGFLKQLHWQNHGQEWSLFNVDGRIVGHIKPQRQQWTGQDLGFDFRGHHVEGVNIDWHQEEGAHDTIRLSRLSLAALQAFLQHANVQVLKEMPKIEEGFLEHLVLRLPSAWWQQKASVLLNQAEAQASLRGAYLQLAQGKHLLGALNGDLVYQRHAWSIELFKELALVPLEGKGNVEIIKLKTPLILHFHDQDHRFDWLPCQLDMPGASATLQGSGQWPDRYRIQGHFASQHLQKWVQSWPDAPFLVQLQAWLKTAIGGGKIDSGHFDLYYQDKHYSGSLQAQVQKGTLQYSPAWPALTDLQGELILDWEKGLTWQGKGRFCQQPLIDMQVAMKGYQMPYFDIEGRGVVEPDQWFACFDHSILKQHFAPFQSVIRLKGYAPLQLSLSFPLNAKDKRPLRYKGQLDLKDLIFDMRHGPWDWHRLQGTLLFDQDRIWGKGLKGYWQGENFDVPLDFNVNTLPVANAASQIIIDFQWHDVWSRILKRWPILNTWLKGRIQGKSLFQGHYVFDRAGKWHRFELQSGLLGTEVKAPWGPVKKAEKVMPLRWQLLPTESGEGFEGTIRLGSALQMRYQANPDHQLDHVRLHLGSTMPSGWLSSEGFELSGFIPSWSFDQHAHEHVAWSFNQPISFDVHLGKALMGNWSEPSVSLKGNCTPDRFQVAWQSPRLQGVFSRAEKGFDVVVKRLRLSSKDQSLLKAIWQRIKPKNIASASKEIPLHLRLQDSQWGDYQLDFLDMSALIEGDRVMADRLLIQDAFDFKGSGFWQMQQPNGLLHLKGQMTSDDFGVAAEKWLAAKSFNLGRGVLDVDFNLPGPGEENGLHRLSGSVELDCRDGRFQRFSEKLEAKLNLGRWLNALSFKSLSKRMALNFDDLVENGYHTDHITGRLVFEKGKVSSQNLTVLGSELSLWLRGNIDVLEYTGDVQLKVQAPVTSSLPVLATLTAGPGAGLVTWVADKLILKKVPGLSIHHYRLIGKADGTIEMQKEEDASW